MGLEHVKHLILMRFTLTSHPPFPPLFLPTYLEHHIHIHTNTQVNSASDYDEAQSASKASHCLNVAGITIGTILLVVAIASLIVGVYYTVILPNQSLSTTTTVG